RFDCEMKVSDRHIGRTTKPGVPSRRNIAPVLEHAWVRNVHEDWCRECISDAILSDDQSDRSGCGDDRCHRAPDQGHANVSIAPALVIVELTSIETRHIETVR